MARRQADEVSAYARAVVRGKALAGRPVVLACERHLRDLREARERGLRWDVARAREVPLFFERFLTLDDGTPFVLQPWQQFIVGSLFGWYTSEGTRRFRYAYVESGKGSGKTPLAAGIGMYMLLADGEARPQCYAAAVKREQAVLTWRDAKGQADRATDLHEQVERREHTLLTEAGGLYTYVSSEQRSLDGLRVHYASVDELHEHPDAFVVGKLRAGTKGCRNALILAITNSGHSRASVCWEQHEYSLRVLTGAESNEAWFAYVCSLDACARHQELGRLAPEPDCRECDDWQDEAVWSKANPNLGVSIHPTYLREQVREAQAIATSRALVMRLNFCLWTESKTTYIPDVVWMRGAEPPSSAPALRWTIGLDLGSSDDLTAAVGVAEDAGVWHVLVRLWCAQATVDRRVREGRFPYGEWVRDGYISVTPGERTDYDFVERDLLALCETHTVVEIAYDRYLAVQLVAHLADALGNDRLVQIGQGFLSMNAPTKELARIAAEGKIRHGGHPVLRWMVANVQTQQDPAGNLKPNKASSGEKIDAVVALLMALGRALARAGAAPPRASVYDTRGVEAW